MPVEWQYPLSINGVKAAEEKIPFKSEANSILMVFSLGHRYY